MARTHSSSKDAITLQGKSLLRNGMTRFFHISDNRMTPGVLMGTRTQILRSGDRSSIPAWSGANLVIEDATLDNSGILFDAVFFPTRNLAPKRLALLDRIKEDLRTSLAQRTNNTDLHKLAVLRIIAPPISDTGSSRQYLVPLQTKYKNQIRYVVQRSWQNGITAKYSELYAQSDQEALSAPNTKCK
jgi:hypothetical protein